MGKTFALLLSAVVLLFALAGLWWFYAYEFGGAGMISCTADAKLCPDGSAVGRTGPNCEFAACPGENANP